MATKGMTVFTAGSEDYTINDQNIADEFDSTVAYGAGSYVYYQGNLYRFKANHAAGSWNASHVMRASLGQDVKEIKNKMFYDSLPLLMNAVELIGTPVNLTNIETLDQYITYAGDVQSSEDFAYTSPISIKKGQTVALLAKGYNQNVGMISVYSSSSYTVVARSVDSTKRIYTYTAENDCQVAFSYDYMVDHAVFLMSSSLQAVRDYLYSDISFAGAVWGKYINYNGVISGGANDFRYTPPVEIKANMKIVFTAAGYNQGVSMMAKYNGEGVNLTPLVISTDSNVNTYTFLVPETMEVCFSYDSTKAHSGYFYLDPESLESNKSDIDFSVFFPKMSVIGDSLSSGELYYNGGYNDRYGDSWLSFIAQHCGCKRNHYSNGGLTAKTWLDNYSAKLQADPVSDLYFIALGTNDAYLHPYEMGSASDEAGANTFAGWYKEIIETVKEKAPYAAIMCLSLYKNSTEWNGLIKSITSLYSNVYYLDFIGNSKIDTDTGGVYTAGSHFTTIGYQYVANVILRQMNEIVMKNMADFKFYGYNNMIEEKYDFES